MLNFTTHELKTWPEHYRAVVSGNKKVEIRNEQDRIFQRDDVLILKEWDPIKNDYTGESTCVKVTHCLRGKPWVPEGYVALSISPIYLTDESQVYGIDCRDGKCEF